MPEQQEVHGSAWSQQTDVPVAAGSGGSGSTPKAWHHHRFPGKKPSQFRAARKAGRDAVAVRATASASVLRYQLNAPPDTLGEIQFSWYVPALIERADLAHRDTDDSPVRLVLAFDGDRSQFSPRDALLSELANTLTGEPMPYATLMYVWCNECKPGEVIRNPRTGRIRKIALEVGPANLSRWLDYRRNIHADFERAFGEAPGALIGIALMTDTDNTRSDAHAWYGPIRFAPKAATDRKMQSGNPP